MKKRSKKKTVSKAKQELWKVFSEYVRRRDADHRGMTRCVTCNKMMHWKALQAGHFVPRARGNALYFDPVNCNTQCFRCNVNLGGNASAYAAYIMKRYGAEMIIELEDRSRETKKFTVEELEKMQADYSDKIKLL